MKSLRAVGVGALAAALACAGGCRESNMRGHFSARLTQEPFVHTADGRGIDLVTLRNQNQMEVRAMTYGGIILSIRTPDRQGQLGDVVLGHETAAGYFPNPPYFGAIIGRFANRIAKGRFSLDGRGYVLPINDGVNHLHGGTPGWDQAIWKADPFQDARGVGVVFTHTSPDGDEGYPGTVNARVTYRLTDDNALILDYQATTDKPTVINLTQHSYFNLSAGRASDVLNHELVINAARYTPVDDGLIPTGDLTPVAGTPFDFRTSTTIGARIGGHDPQIERGHGYDHNFVLNRTGSGLTLAARVIEPLSGRTLDISTTEPGLQLYSGNLLAGTMAGKAGATYGARAGLCLETQHFPDAPNHPGFPSTVLRPGETYRSRTMWKFGTVDESIKR